MPVGPSITGALFGKQGRRAGVDVSFQNGAEVQAALKDIEAGLKTQANRELRAAAKDIADKVLIPQLKRSARSSPMKIAQAFADTATARSDRLVMVNIGGAAPALSGFKRGVGVKKAAGRRTRSGRDATSRMYAASMAWGSEYGPFPGADVNNYGLPRKDPAGYWVTKGITSSLPEASKRYEKAIDQIIARYSKYR